MLTKRTYTVRNVNGGRLALARLTKCTGKPGRLPQCPKFAGTTRRRTARVHFCTIAASWAAVMQLRTHTVRFCIIARELQRMVQKCTAGVFNVNRGAIARLLLTFGTYTVHFVNANARRGSLLTKCTGKPVHRPQCRR